ncbi:hypothetical protein [Micromonospora aurantiaca (nom. illeg.)]|uniref:hypothetical protein n=1 Tax=Micromonospora aurantiaca (nom. illeg.) TaxID=47850 RepID=UPI0033FF9DB6
MTTSLPRHSVIPCFPRTSEPVHPVASLIDQHEREARKSVRASAFHRWNQTQTWHYALTFRSFPADVAVSLTEAAKQRRVLAVLLAYRRAGAEYILPARWNGVKAAALTGPQPRQPFMVVTTGHGVVVDDEHRYASYPQGVGGEGVGEVWLSGTDWWAVRYSPDGDPAETVVGGPRATADAAAYAVGFLNADR